MKIPYLKGIRDLCVGSMLCIYYLVIEGTYSIYRLLKSTENALDHIYILLANGCLTRFIRQRMDWSMHKRALALLHLDEITTIIENYYHRQDAQTYCKRICSKVLLDCYECLLLRSIQMGAIENAMSVILRSQTHLGINEISTKYNLCPSTARLVQVTLSAAKIVDQGVITTIFQRNSGVQPQNTETPSHTEDSSQTKTGTVIPFPISRIRPSANISHKPLSE